MIFFIKLDTAIMTKQQTGKVLEEIKRIENIEGKEKQQVKVGEVQISTLL